MGNKKVLENKCPNCGAPMRYDPDSGMLRCDHCKTEFKIGRKEGKNFALSNFDFNQIRDQAVDLNAEPLPIYHCETCGAEIIAPAEQMALTCPYCRSNIVLTDKISGNLRPDGVIPFKIKPDELPQAMKRFYSKRKLLDKDYFTFANMGKITGVYVPFWCFSGKLHGDFILEGTDRRHYREGDYDVIEESYYRLLRGMEIEYEDIPVDASTRLCDEEMDAVEPFDFSEVKPFSVDYLAGYTADRFDVEPESMIERANKRMEKTAYEIISQKCQRGYDSVRLCEGDVHIDINARYLLMPMYTFTLHHGSEKMKYLVNGQTGKVVGKLPDFKKAAKRYYWSKVGIFSGILMAASVILYFLGR